MNAKSGNIEEHLISPGSRKLLAKLAALSGKTDREILDAALARAAPALEMAWTAAPQPGAIVSSSLAPDRQRIERRALHWRAQLLRRELLEKTERRVAELPLHRYASPDAATAFLALGKSGALTETETIAVLGEPDPEVSAAEVLKAMSVASASVIYSFDVASSAALLRDVACRGFGEVQQVCLRGTMDERDEYRRLSAIDVEVGLDVGHEDLQGHDPQIVFEGGHIKSIARDPARFALDHVLATLLAMGIHVHYDDFGSDELPEFINVTVCRRFADESESYVRAVPDRKPWQARGASRVDYSAPLQIDAACFVEAWEYRDELAAFTNRKVMTLIAEYQRLFLLIEADLAGPRPFAGKAEDAPHKTAAGEEAALAFVRHLEQLAKRRPVLFKGAADYGKVRDELLSLRDRVSHLQRRDAKGAELPKPFGVEAYDSEFRERLVEAIGIVSALGKELLQSHLPNVRGRHEREDVVSTSELIQLTKETELLRGAAAQNVVELVLQRIIASTPVDHAHAAFVVTQIERGEADKFYSIARAAIACAEMDPVFAAFVDAARGRDERAATFRSVLGAALTSGDGWVEKLRDAVAPSDWASPFDSSESSIGG